MKIRMKPLSDEERRLASERETATIWSFFTPIVPVVCFFGVLSFLDRHEILPKSVMDELFGRVDEGVTPVIGLLVLAGVYGVSFGASFLVIRRIQRWRDRSHD